MNTKWSLGIVGVLGLVALGMVLANNSPNGQKIASKLSGFAPKLPV